MKKLSRILCLLMTFVMVFCMIGGVPAWAAEDDPSATAPVTEPPLESEPVTAGETEPPPETEPILETLPISAEELLPEDMGLFSTRATYPDGKYRQRAVIWNTVGEKVNYTYNGKVNKYNTLLMHTLWYNGQWNAAYCIEPGKTLYVNSDYDEVENTGVDPWGKLDYSKQRGVGLALLYGYPNGIDSPDLKTQVAYQLATYLIVHEIILGWREDVHPFTRTNDAYFDVFGGGTPEKIEKLEITSEYHSSIHTKHLNNEDVWFAYDHISNALATHDLVPSFAASHKNMAPTHTMVSNGDGTYSITLTDSNNILSAYSFANTAELTFTKSADGKSLTITTKGSELPETVIAPTRIVPSIEKSAYLIWNASNGSQELCTLKGAQNDPVPAYFKLKLPVGSMSIYKLPDDGENYGGWNFSVYADEACTQLVKGPLTTSDTGVIAIENLPVGNYWVKELGHTDKYIEDQYYCLSQNPQPVTITSGGNSIVTMLNNRIPRGHLSVCKNTNTFTDLGGWKFALYYDEACQNLAYDPKETDAWGLALFDNVDAGTYWLKELGNTNPELEEIYTCASPNPQQVTIVAGETSSADVQNNRIFQGHLSVYKGTDTFADSSGWKFALYHDEACQNLAYGPVETDGWGLALFESVDVGNYWLKELGNINPEMEKYYTCTSRNPQPVTIIADSTVNMSFENKFNTGAIVIHKIDSYQNTLAGAHFLLEWSMNGSNWKPVEASSIPGWGKCTTPGLKDGILVTDSTGNVSFEGLALGVYYRITEVKAPNGFQLLGDYAFEGMLNSKDEVVTLNVVNAPVFTLPHTGSRSMIGISAGLGLCLLTCLGAVYFLRKKES